MNTNTTKAAAVATVNHLNSVKLLIIGYALVHKDSTSAEGLLLEPLNLIADDMGGPARDEIKEEFATLVEQGFIKIIEQEDKTAPARFQLTQSCPELVQVISQTHGVDPKLPFTHFVDAITVGFKYSEHGIERHRAQALKVAPFPSNVGVYRQPRADMGQGPSMAAIGRRDWTPSGYYPFIAPLGQVQPEGSSVESYADEPAQFPGQGLVERSTYIRGVKIEPADARLLAFKLARFLNAATQMSGLEDNTFQIHVTFKGMEFTVLEAREIMEVISQ
jgi:hypothetical protein